MKKINKIIILIVLSIVAVMPTTVALAAYYSYNYNYEFSYGFSSSNKFLTPDAYVYVNNSSSGATGYFYVDLYKADSVGSTFLGTRTFPRNGYGAQKYNAKGGGNYWMKFRKADDGLYVTGHGKIYD